MYKQKTNYLLSFEQFGKRIPVRPAGGRKRTALKKVQIAITLGALIAIVAIDIANGQSSPRLDIREVLAQSCTFSDGDLSRVSEGSIVVKAVKMREKKEISLCGIVRIDRASVPTIGELRESLSQKENRTVLAGGTFGPSPSKYDLQALKLTKNDLDDLLKCQPDNCKLMVSRSLLHALNSRPDWPPDAVADLYTADLVEFANNFTVNGINALKIFDGPGTTLALADQNRAIIDRLPILDTISPKLKPYLKEFPSRSLAGGDTTLAWSVLNFGLKPFVTITSSTTFSTDNGKTPVALITHQVYASRYINASVAVSGIVSDDSGNLYLVFADITRSDAIGGLFSGLKKSIATDKGTDKLKELLGNAKEKLENPGSARTVNLSPSQSFNESTTDQWTNWRDATGLIAAFGIIVLTILGIGSYWNRNDSYE